MASTDTESRLRPYALTLLGSSLVAWAILAAPVQIQTPEPIVFQTEEKTMISWEHRTAEGFIKTITATWRDADGQGKSLWEWEAELEARYPANVRDGESDLGDG